MEESNFLLFLLSFLNATDIIQKKQLIVGSATIILCSKIFGRGEENEVL